MIKVLHFVSTPAKWSGVMSVIMNYYRHIDRTKIQFDFLCFIPCEESYEEEISSLGGTVFFVSKPSSLSAVNELREFFKKHSNEYQWLHNHEVYLSFLLKPLSKHYGVNKFVIHSHATQYSDRPLPAIRNRFLCIPIRFMKCERFACSEAAGIFLFGGNKRTSFKVLPNAIETQKYSFNEGERNICRQELNLTSEFLIGHIGRFVPQKNHVSLVEIFHQVYNVSPKTHLLLVGDGPLKSSVQEKVKSLGLENNVHFTGYRSDIAFLLNSMDLFVLPSLYEGLPMSCLEAQASGLPCIIADTITEEVRLSSNVHRIPLTSQKQWVDKCLYYAEHSQSTANRGLRKTPNCIPDIIIEAQKLKDFYEMRL